MPGKSDLIINTGPVLALAAARRLQILRELFAKVSIPYEVVQEEKTLKEKLSKEKLEVVHGSGNIFRDFQDPDADVKQLKVILAAEIIKTLDRDALSVRKAQQRTGFDASDFTRIRNAKLDRFTVDRLMTIVNRPI